MSEFVAESFTNEFGQVIEPGEEVLFAGTSWKSTSIQKGIFKGVRYGLVYKTVPLTDASGALIQEERTSIYGTTYLFTKNETRSSREILSVVVGNVYRGPKYIYHGSGNLEKIGENYGTSILPLKRVYKISTPLLVLNGKRF